MSRALAVAIVLGSALAPGCCCDSGPDRLLRVEIDDERDTLREELVFNADNDFPQNAVVEPYYYGERNDRLHVTPLIELFDEGGTSLPLTREQENNEGGCALVERYVPASDLVIGERLTLVHRASISPGDLDIAGSVEGELADQITTFSGEAAFVATLVVSDPIDRSVPPGSGGAGGTDLSP